MRATDAISATLWNGRGVVFEMRQLVKANRRPLQPVEFSTAEAALLSEHAGLLEQFGLSLEKFGTNTVLVTAYPVMLAQMNLAQMVRDAASVAVVGGCASERRQVDSAFCTAHSEFGRFSVQNARRFGFALCRGFRAVPNGPPGSC